MSTYLKPFHAALILSMALHIALIALIKFPSEAPKRSITPVEIIRKNLTKETPPQSSQTAPVTPTPKDNPPLRSAPPIPPPLTAPTPSLPAPVITPVVPTPNNPPRPMSLDEFLDEKQREALRMGPDRSIKGITEDYVRDTRDVPGEESVSFNRMAFKYDSYFYAFARSLYREWQYPDAAAKRGEAGIVRVNFAVTKEGKITDITLVESSGYPALDREVLRTLKNMDDVPLPESLELNILKISGYFIYSLDGRYRVF